MTTKRRKLIAFVLLALIGGVIAYSLLRQDDEPKYQGRSLSECLARYEDGLGHAPTPEFDQAHEAIRSIGTNALPCLLKWMDYEPSGWRVTLLNKLPTFIADWGPIDNWLDGDRRRADYSALGFRLLGTNAASAIPALKALMNDPKKQPSSRVAIDALGAIGVPAIPALKAAFADTNRSDRLYIFFVVIDRLPGKQTKEAFLPIMLEMLNDHELAVVAENFVKEYAPEALTNAAPK